MAHAFPVHLPAGDTTHLSAWILKNCLPPATEAWSLFETFWEHYAWLYVHGTEWLPCKVLLAEKLRSFNPFTRVGFVEQILAPLYHRPPDSEDKPLGHRLALLFVVCSIYI